MALTLPQDQMPEAPEPEFPWMTRPADLVPLGDVKAIANRANKYFTQAHRLGVKPTLTGMALALGVTGPASLQRLAQRRPELRWIISRCLTAVAHGYETTLAEGGPAQGAVFMLKHLPEFDVEEPKGSKPVQYWTEKRELVINARVYGVRNPEDEGADLSPREVYLRVIHGEDDCNVLEVSPEEKTSDPNAVNPNSLEQLLSDSSKFTVYENED
jgi:hypothetical protein